MDALYTVFLMLTEALKGAGIGRFIAKGKSLKVRVVKQFRKGADPDRKFDTRGKVFEYATYLRTSNRPTDIKLFMVKAPQDQTAMLEYNHIYIDTVWTLAFFNKQSVSNADVIRDVRKQKLEDPPRPNKKYTFKAQKELLELWIVAVNIQDFIKDFLQVEFDKRLFAYHKEALAVLENLRDASKPVDLSQLELLLTRDLRQTTRIAILHTASEFLFYSAAADYPDRYFFSMDIRDLGVEVLQLYETSATKIVDGKLNDRRLADETFRSSDQVVQRRRVTYDYVVETFGRYYNLLKESARLKRTDGLKEARQAFGKRLNTTSEMPDFAEAVQVMLGGDEVFVAAHPRFAAYIHNIVADLDTATHRDRGLNMRTCVALSSAQTPGDRKSHQTAHHQAMTAADETLGIMKEFERTQRRVERLIQKLEENDKKKADAPKFAKELEKLRLMKLFVRVYHGDPKVLSATDFAKSIARIRKSGLDAIDNKTYQLVDHNGNIVDRDQLKKESKALEDAVRAKVGKDNVWVDNPPAVDARPIIGDDDDDDKDK